MKMFSVEVYSLCYLMMKQFLNIAILTCISFNGIICQEVIYYPSVNGFRTKIHNIYDDQNNMLGLNKEKTNLIGHKLPIHKRSSDPVFHGYPKTQEEIWESHFLIQSLAYDQTPSLIHLLHHITYQHLNECTPVILYDTFVENGEKLLLQQLFKGFPVPYKHGRIYNNNSMEVPHMIVPGKKCLHFLVFLADVMRCADVLGLQATSRVVVVARSSQWRVHEFLTSKSSTKLVNLLVIGQTFKDEDDTLIPDNVWFDKKLVSVDLKGNEKYVTYMVILHKLKEAPYILYTHKLYTDGLGSSQPQVLTSWAKGKLARPNVSLFPIKSQHGYAGHRFLVAAANQPPYVFRRIITDEDGGNPQVSWDGLEYRMLQILAKRHNFSIEIVEPQNLRLGPGDAVSEEIKMRRADIGIGGLYTTQERMENMDMSISHSEDCAVFISLMSTALPRYRAIMGPFHWTVWLALTFTYLLAIFPLAFSDKHTLRHLIHNSGEVENMFWYVFGTFTNCFTFAGKNSWTKTSKVTTRLLIGWYWIFTIIITSCYTGSIIAFVTLPIYPSTIDSVGQLLHGFYRIGTLDRGGWERWFFNSSDEDTNRLLGRLELVPNIESGIRNTTKAFFWPYAFLGSKAQLEFIVQSNFSKVSSKRAVLHISDECFVPFAVGLIFPYESIYTSKLNEGIIRMVQGGLIKKLLRDVEWEMQRSPNGMRLQVSTGKLQTVLTQEKGLALDDTHGMFLLLGAGFLLGAGALLSEWMGGCNRKCRPQRRKSSTFSQDSTCSDGRLIQTPNTHPSNVSLNPFFIDDIVNNDAINGETVRISSATSRDTLENQVIHVTEDNILVHNSDTMDDMLHKSHSDDLDEEIDNICQSIDNQRNDTNINPSPYFGEKVIEK